MTDRAEIPVLGTKAAAAELGVSVGTLRKWADAGDVVFARTPGGHRRFSRGELERVKRTMYGRARADLGEVPHHRV